jgi:hypothetical protein
MMNRLQRLHAPLGSRSMCWQSMVVIAAAAYSMCWQSMVVIAAAAYSTSDNRIYIFTYKIFTKQKQKLRTSRAPNVAACPDGLKHSV